MESVKIVVLVIFLLGPIENHCENLDDDYYFSMESTSPPNLTYVDTKSLSGNVDLATLEVLTTTSSQSMPQPKTEKSLSDSLFTTTQIPTAATKEPTDGPTVLMDVFARGTSGLNTTTSTTEKLIVVTPFKAELIDGDSTTVATVEAEEKVVIVTPSPTVFDHVDLLGSSDNFEQIFNVSSEEVSNFDQIMEDEIDTTTVEIVETAPPVRNLTAKPLFELFTSPTLLMTSDLQENATNYPTTTEQLYKDKETITELIVLSYNLTVNSGFENIVVPLTPIELQVEKTFNQELLSKEKETMSDSGEDIPTTTFGAETTGLTNNPEENVSAVTTSLVTEIPQPEILTVTTANIENLNKHEETTTETLTTTKPEEEKLLTEITNISKETIEPKVLTEVTTEASNPEEITSAVTGSLVTEIHQPITEILTTAMPTIEDFRKHETTTTEPTTTTNEPEEEVILTEITIPAENLQETITSEENLQEMARKQIELTTLEPTRMTTTDNSNKESSGSEEIISTSCNTESEDTTIKEDPDETNKENEDSTTISWELQEEMVEDKASATISKEAIHQMSTTETLHQLLDDEAQVYDYGQRISRKLNVPQTTENTRVEEDRQQQPERPEEENLIEDLSSFMHIDEEFLNHSKIQESSSEDDMEDDIQIDDLLSVLNERLKEEFGPVEDDNDNIQKDQDVKVSIRFPTTEEEDHEATTSSEIRKEISTTSNYQELTTIVTTTESEVADELENETRPELLITMDDKPVKFSIKITIKDSSFFVPPDAHLIHDNFFATHNLNITWKSSKASNLNNSLWLNLDDFGKIAQLNLVKGDEMHTYGPVDKSENKTDRKVIALDHQALVYFSNTDFLNNLLSSEASSSVVRKNAGFVGAMGAFGGFCVVVAVVAIYTIRKCRRKISGFKPNEDHPPAIV